MAPQKKLKDNLTLIKFFNLGVNLEGYWNFDQMALQVEDIYNVLVVKYPHFDFFLLLDQSSGHGKMREGSLNVNSMGMRWDGRQQILRKTITKEVGPYRRLFNVGDQQAMVFEEGDGGPFYLPDNH